MKKERTLLLVLMVAACQAVAQPQPSNTKSASQTNAPSASATFTIAKPKFHLFGPIEPVQTGKNPRYVEGMDTRAWTTVAETRTSRQAFPNGENHEAGLCLLWWGSERRVQN